MKTEPTVKEEDDMVPWESLWYNVPGQDHKLCTTVKVESVLPDVTFDEPDVKDENETGVDVWEMKVFIYTKNGVNIVKEEEAIEQNYVPDFSDTENSPIKNNVILGGGAGVNYPDINIVEKNCEYEGKMINDADYTCGVLDQECYDMYPLPSLSSDAVDAVATPPPSPPPSPPRPDGRRRGSAIRMVWKQEPKGRGNARPPPSPMGCGNARSPPPAKGQRRRLENASAAMACPSPPPKKRGRRATGTARRLENNYRERVRMHELNAEYVALRDILPRFIRQHSSSRATKRHTPTKKDTIKSTINYVKALINVIYANTRNRLFYSFTPGEDSNMCQVEDLANEMLTSSKIPQAELLSTRMALNIASCSNSD